MSDFRKNVFCIILLLSLLLCMTGCTDKVPSLVEKGNYEEALTLIEKNPKKYADMYDEVRFKVAEDAFEQQDYAHAASLLQDNNFAQATDLLDEVNFFLAKKLIEEEDWEQAIKLLKNTTHKDASDLLQQAKNLMAAIQIETHYNEMQGEIDEYNPDKWDPYFDYMDGTDFYLRICDILNETYDIIIRDGTLDRARDKFIEIFGYEPSSVSSAKTDISKLKENLTFEEFYESPFCYYSVMHTVMSDLGLDSEAVRFEMTDTSGFMIIEKPFLFLEENGISAKTFAYLLGSCENMGAAIERDGERIVISYENYHSGNFYSRGYYYCVPNAQHEKVLTFYQFTEFDFYDAYIDDDGLGVTVEFANPKNYKIKYMHVNLILRDKDGNHVECTSELLTNVSGKTITFDAFFDDVTFDDLPDSEYSLYYFLSVVIQ